MEASAFFSRLLRPPGLGRGRSSSTAPPDDVGAFERAWTGLQVGRRPCRCHRINMDFRLTLGNTSQATLLQPDESQLLRGIHSTDVPRQLDWLVKALVYESSLEEQGKWVQSVGTGICVVNAKSPVHSDPDPLEAVWSTFSTRAYSVSWSSLAKLICRLA
jgi:hypothetical protein